MGSTTRLRSVIGIAAMAAMLASAALPLAAQGTGTVRGRVTEQGTGRPLSGAQVAVSGTQRRAVTNASGDYTLANVGTGQLTIRATLLGFGTSTQSVNVAAGETATANFSLSTSAVSLDAVVVTGTPGATQKRAIGNAVSQINAADIVDQAPIPNVSALLQARSAGLTISPSSGTAGTASVINIRGINSIVGNNTPVIYLDGVRLNTGTYDIGVGGQDMDVLENIDPNDIESVEVIKGPAAATLYGSEAAAGVIQIITKKGKVGDQKVAFSVKGQYGNTDWEADMPTNYWTCSAAEIRSGNRAYVAGNTWYGGCAGLDSLAPASERLISEQPLRSYVETGHVRGIDVSARGGGDRYSFYVSGGRDENNGIFPIDISDRTSARANFFVQPRDNMDLSLNLSVSRTDRTLPENDNNSTGFIRNAWRGRPGAILSTGWDVGWLGLGPSQVASVQNDFRSDQLVMAATANWQPFTWFRNRVTLGVDASDKNYTNYYAKDRTGRLPFGATFGRGYISQWEPNDRDYTMDYAGTLSFDLPREVSSQFSFGMQVLAERYHSLQAEGIGLDYNSVRLVNRANETNAFEQFREKNSVGIFVQQELGYKDRLFLTGALRADDNSAFGSDFDYEIYPKLSASYVISDENFFSLPAFDELKLRMAWGRAGTAPSAFAADRTYSPIPILTATGEALVSGLIPGAVGNADLTAETGSELELGFDASLFGERLGIEATYYNQKTYDALLNVPVAPSSGFSGSRQTNVGEIQNSGIELTFSGSPLQSRPLRWDARLAFASNKNELISFNGARDEPIIYGYGGGSANQRIAEGYPLGGYWTYDVVRNADGSVVTNAAGRALLQDDPTYIGPSMPTREISMSNTFTVLGNLQLYTFLDYKGGHYLYNLTQSGRDGSFNTWEINNPEADPDDILIRRSGSDILYIEKADFLRLREVSMTYRVPNRLVRRFGTDDLSVSLAGRNLALWTDYSGPDPEVSTEGADEFTRADFYTVPALRQIVATVNVRF